MSRQAKLIPEAVKTFDSLPDDARIPADVVRALFSISDRTLHRRIQAGAIPAPQHPSPRVFSVGAIRRALRA